jgi:hypothetical protein
MRMGNQGGVVVERIKVELESGDTTEDQAAARNGVELQRVISAMKTWEERLRNSPLDTKLQDFVAYHQDVVRRFQAWFSSHGNTIPP